MRTASILSILLALFYAVPQGLMTSYTNVTALEAYNMLGSNMFNLVLDVRTQSEYNSGHLRNAKLIPVSELASRLDELNPTDEILVYCHAGSRSSTASQILVDNGFQNIYNMLGGITAWIVEGYPVFIKYPSIQEAINTASQGDAIYVASGTHYENVLINKSISLIGENKELTIIDGNRNGTVIHVISPNVTITEFTIQNGGSLLPGSSLWLENVVHSNTISNDSIDIWLNSAQNNTIYHNNFLDVQQPDNGYGSNIWDNGCEGNYWSNYNGSDIDSDGIGDTNLPWGGVDQYPLMSPFLFGDINHDAIVDITDIILSINAFGTASGDFGWYEPHWFARKDVNEDGVVDITDIWVIIDHYGDEWQ
ncbi:MAG: hypothetical protein JSV51_01665 [Candidatus Bathyarchaeota archaeon]|nr:MAG: hypothetical protein JSV51_01665 [Candidatus Bathyarchaeota archaeon]